MRSSVLRSKKYKAKISGEIAKSRLDSYNMQQKSLFRTSVSRHVEIEQLVKAYLATQDISSMLVNYYILFAKNMINKSDAERDIEFNKWAERNLSWYHMRNIGRSIFNRRLNLIRIDTEPATRLYLTMPEGTGAVTQDKSGYGNNGTIISATWTSGVLGNGLNFAGSPQRVNVANAASLNFGSGDFTVMAWFKSPSTATKRTLVTHYKSGSLPCICLTILDNHKLRIFVRDDGGDSVEFNNTTVDNNVWHLGALVRRGQDFELWLDGIFLIKQTAAAVGNTDVAYSWSIGHLDTSEYMTGVIDEVRVFARAITAEEFKKMYDAEKPE